MWSKEGRWAGRGRRFAGPLGVISGCLLLGLVGGCATADLPTTADEVGLSVQDPVRLTDGDGYTDPAWSLDGGTISFSGEGYGGLYAVPAAGGASIVVASRYAVSGFRHRWIESDGEPVILCPARGRKPAVHVTPGGAELRELVTPPVEPIYARGDELFVRGPDGERQLTAGEDRFFDEHVSPTRDHVAAVGLRDGIHVFDVDTGELLAVAEGTHPAWTPDGRWVLFERTVDDGHQVLNSDLWALSVQDGRAIPLTATPGRLEGHPAVSPDGTEVAYVEGGAVYRAQLVEVTP